MKKYFIRFNYKSRGIRGGSAWAIADIDLNHDGALISAAKEVLRKSGQLTAVELEYVCSIDVTSFNLV